MDHLKQLLLNDETLLRLAQMVVKVIEDKAMDIVSVKMLPDGTKAFNGVSVVNGEDKGLLGRMLKGEAQGVKLDDPDGIPTLHALLSVKVAGSASPVPVLPAPEVAVEQYLVQGDIAKRRTRRTRAEFKRVLLAYLRWAESVALHPSSSIAASRYVDEILSPGSHHKTINKKIGILARFAKWGAKRGYGPSPWADLKIEGAKHSARDERPAYDAEQIMEFLGVFNPEAAARDPRLWHALLLLYTGARSNEIAQLLKADVRTEFGISYLSLNDDGENKRLKTPGSARHIPLHSAIREPFLAYVATLPEGGKVFPTWTAAANRNASHPAGKFFSMVKAAAGLGLPDLHSLRHTVITKLRDAGAPEDQVCELTGHTFGKSMAFSRYAKATPEGLARLAATVEELRF